MLVWGFMFVLTERREVQAPVGHRRALGSHVHRVSTQSVSPKCETGKLKRGRKS